MTRPIALVPHKIQHGSETLVKDQKHQTAGEKIISDGEIISRSLPVKLVEVS